MATNEEQAAQAHSEKALHVPSFEALGYVLHGFFAFFHVHLICMSRQVLRTINGHIT